MLSEFNFFPEDFQEISCFLTPLKLNKGAVFIKEGKKNDKIGIMLSGLMISTYISEKGKEEVSRIYSEINGQTVVSNHESFYNDSTSTENIVAIEDTALMVLTKDNLKQILDEHPKFQSVVNQISEKSYINAIERIKQFQSFSAKERVRIYYERYNELFNKLNRIHLSSFLGINRNDFTRFLKEIVKEK